MGVVIDITSRLNKEEAEHFRLAKLFEIEKISTRFKEGTTPLDLSFEEQTEFGKFILQQLAIRDKERPDLSDDFVYLMCLNEWGLVCHHPGFDDNGACRVCGTRFVKK